MFCKLFGRDQTEVTRSKAQNLHVHTWLSPQCRLVLLASLHVFSQVSMPPCTWAADWFFRPFAAAARGLGRGDTVWHAAVGGVVLLGFLAIAPLADALWESQNSGYVFQAHCCFAWCHCLTCVSAVVAVLVPWTINTSLPVY